MYLDVKVKIWQRIQISDETATKKDVIKTLKEGSHYDLWDSFEVISCEDISETEEVITPSENEDHSTLELYGDDGILLWGNGII